GCAGTCRARGGGVRRNGPGTAPGPWPSPVLRASASCGACHLPRWSTVGTRLGVVAFRGAALGSTAFRAVAPRSGGEAREGAQRDGPTGTDLLGDPAHDRAADRGAPEEDHRLEGE